LGDEVASKDCALAELDLLVGADKVMVRVIP
jgi:hypothetical protein